MAAMQMTVDVKPANLIDPYRQLLFGFWLYYLTQVVPSVDFQGITAFCLYWYYETCHVWTFSWLLPSAEPGKNIAQTRGIDSCPLLMHAYQFGYRESRRPLGYLARDKIHEEKTF